MLKIAQMTIGFKPEIVKSLMCVLTAILFAGNTTIASNLDDSCTLDENHAVAVLLGVGIKDLSSALTSYTITTAPTSKRDLDLETMPILLSSI